MRDKTATFVDSKVAFHLFVPGSAALSVVVLETFTILSSFPELKREPEIVEF
jgi:hypothetical protein